METNDLSKYDQIVPRYTITRTVPDSSSLSIVVLSLAQMIG